ADDARGEVEIADGARRRRPARRGCARRGGGAGSGGLNKLSIAGRIVELGALAFTPAGLPTVLFTLHHESDQDEAGGKRKVQAEIGAVAFEAQARLIAKAKLDS